MPTIFLVVLVLMFVGGLIGWWCRGRYERSRLGRVGWDITAGRSFRGFRFPGGADGDGANGE
jgi:hypothetical protein